MQYAVEHQDTNLVDDGVLVFGGLLLGAVDGDGDLAEEAVASAAGKRKHVGRIVVAEELQVQALQFGVAGKQAIEAAAVGDLGLKAFGKRTYGRTVEPRRTALE